jgi:hypothetical protein
VFTAKFSKGLTGWTRGSAASWKVTSNGLVTSSGTSDELLAPFSTAKLHDFAVQATIKPVGSPLQSTSGYGVVVRAKTPKNGISGGSVTSDNPEYNTPLILWNDNSVGGARATLTTGFNTFRMEVHGTDYSLSINGTHIVSFTIAGVSPAATFTHVGIWTVGQKLQVKSLTVTKLGVANALTPRPPVDAVNLVTGDVPAGFQSLGNSFFTDEELAQLDDETADTVTSTGLLLSHQASFGAQSQPTSGPYAVNSYVYAYSSPETAAAALAGDWTTEQAAKGQNPNYSTTPLSGVGNEAYVLFYDYSESGYGTPFNGTLASIFFRSGSYEVTVFEDFVAGTVSQADMQADVTALAKVMDARIQHVSTGG